MVKQDSMLIGDRRGSGAEGLRNNDVPGHAGQTQLVILATDRDQPGVVKRATFYFPGWNEGAEAFDTLAMIAGIVQDSCAQADDVRQRDGGGKSSHRERSAGARHTMADGVKEA